MSRFLILLLVVAPSLAMAQRTFKFKVVSVTTGKPMAKKWFTILKNQDEYVNFSPTDTNGVCTFIIRNFDSTATYHAEIVNSWNNQVEPGWYDITSVINDIPTIKVKPASYAMPFGCGEVMYLPYRPKEPNSMNDLPPVIRQKIDRYFVSRVGKGFYKKILLNGGQLINLKRFYAVNPRAQANHYIPPAYSLCFMVWDSSSHTSSYTFQLKLDSNGILKSPVPLPDIKHHPEKATIMSLEQVKPVAITEGFDKAWTQAKTVYHVKSQSIVWAFEQTEPGDGHKRSDTLFVDAHNGKVVDRVTRYVEVMYE